MQGEAKGCIALMQNYSSVAAICRVKSAGSHLSCTKVTTLSLQVADFFFSSDYRWDLQGGIHARMGFPFGVCRAAAVAKATVGRGRMTGAGQPSARTHPPMTESIVGEEGPVDLE